MENKTIGLAGPLSSHSGYGEYARSIAMSLLLSYENVEDLNILLFDLIPETLSTSERLDLSNSKYSKLLKHITPPQVIQSQFFDLFLTVSIPQAFAQKGLVNIGMTALVQTDKAHPILIQHCNRMDEVFVMSQFNVETLKHSMFKLQDQSQLNINVPIKTLPYAYVPVITDIKKTNITQYIDSIPQDFLFLSVGEWLPGSIGSDRKDLGSLISVFLQKFANNEHVGLLLKVDQGRSTILSQYMIRQRINEIVNRLGIKIIKNNIYFISGILSQNAMQQIYKHNKVKCYVSFSHGQSFGIPIFQFITSTGKPILIPYHSGLTDYIQPQCAEILLHKTTQIPQQLMQTFLRQFMIPDSNWFTVDYKYAGYKMMQIVSNYNNLISKSLQHKELLVDKYNINKISKHLKSLLDSYLFDGAGD